jgi:membrane associated rhomboid family serine protease
MLVMIVLGALFTVLGLLTVAFPRQATALDVRFSSARAREAAANPTSWRHRPASRVRFAGLAMAFVGVMVVIAGFVGRHHG